MTDYKNSPIYSFIRSIYLNKITKAGLFIILVTISSSRIISAQCVRMATWNIQDLGRTKNAEEIHAIARLLRTFDVVAIQEVVAIDPAGAQKVAAIVDELDRMGADWDYVLSDPTSHDVPQSRERYAILFKRSKIQVIYAALDVKHEDIFVREPYMVNIKLKTSSKTAWLVNFHSLPHSKHPEVEIGYLNSYFPAATGTPLILLGDWNLDEDHAVWSSFTAYNLQPIVRREPTTLKRSCEGENYKNHCIDNIYAGTGVTLRNGGVVDFVGDCENLAIARGLSDHLIVFGDVCF